MKIIHTILARLDIRGPLNCPLKGTSLPLRLTITTYSELRLKMGFRRKLFSRWAILLGLRVNLSTILNSPRRSMLTIHINQMLPLALATPTLSKHMRVAFVQISPKTWASRWRIYKSTTKTPGSRGGAKRLGREISICLGPGAIPMPVALPGPVCGPQVIGTGRPGNMDDLANLNPSPSTDECVSLSFFFVSSVPFLSSSFWSQYFRC